MLNRRVLLAKRPQGAPKLEDFTVVDHEMPAIGDGQVLLRNLVLSLDPYMRGLMRERKGSYAPPTPLDEAPGGGTVARVTASRDPRYRDGDLVIADGGWQAFSAVEADSLRKLPPDMPQPSLALGVLGMTGFTAWHGLLAIGEPKAGDTLLVGAASGAVGAVVGQIGRLKGCRVVGIAGGHEKCRYAVEELGFAACIDHRSSAFVGDLAAAVPRGVDIYFENIGGAVFEAVWPHLNVNARVPVCGVVSQANAEALNAGPDRWPDVAYGLIVKRIKMQGFLIVDHFGASFETFATEMAGWLATGEIRAREDVSEGLESAPEAFIGLLEGRNFGKTLVRIQH